MIKELEYKQRRERLGAQLQKNSLAVVFSAEYKTRSNDTEFPFRQNSNFFYLSGFLEDKSILLFLKSGKKVKTLLFVAKKDKEQELWNGKRLGVKAAKKQFVFDEIYEYEEYEQRLEEYVKDVRHVYYDFASKNPKLSEFEKYKRDFYSYHNIAKSIELMRLIKSDAEIKLIKKAISITKEAHHKAISLAKEFSYEYELQAEIEYVFKKNGALSDAYTSIVACGNSANTLHYINNDKALIDGELILIDAGCEYNYYASDITRTIPVSGKFTTAQKELYEMVLEVELEIISMIKPHVLRSSLQKKSEELLCKGMIRLGILKGTWKKLLKKNAHKKYYPHGIGHWMGIDVHDQSPYKDEKGKELPLEVGMVMTIEPGIYIDKNDTTVPKRFRGIGIRIEDDILVTESSYENLSQGIAKSVQEIEAIG